MGVYYSSVAGYGVVFSQDEIVKFVKGKNIYVEFDSEDYFDHWECAEAVSREYSLNFFYAGNSMTGDGLCFLFGVGRRMDEYSNDDAFMFNKIETPSRKEDYAIQALSEHSGKEPGFYAGMHVG